MRGKAGGKAGVTTAASRGAASSPLARKKNAPALEGLPPAAAAELRAKGERLAAQLNGLYPNPPIPLNHETSFQLLVAVVLSAQTTDKKVNEVTPALFAQAPDPQAMAAMEAAEIQELIKQIGLAKTKAGNLKRSATMLVELHGGAVPRTFEELEALPGVGHKTASVVMAQAFGHPSFPVDTHIHRLAQRWGLTDGKNVEQTEADLKAIFDEKLWNELHLQIIYFGREHCPAQRHDPAACPICSWAAVSPYDQPGQSPLKPGQSARTPNGKAGSTAKPRGRKAGNSAEAKAATPGREEPPPAEDSAFATPTVKRRRATQRPG